MENNTQKQKTQKLVINITAIVIVIIFLVYYFLPQNAKTELIKIWFKIRLEFTDINHSNKIENIIKHKCWWYVNKDICENILIPKIVFKNTNESVNLRKQLYFYCIKKENINKKYCENNNSYIKAGILIDKLPILEKELKEWNKDNNTPFELKLKI